ncbi:MAG: DUF2892 domain-containing protein [Cytophagales bacterium]|nr:DUF2892 domain-containing protein [Cytophagales bacterium]
MRARLINGIAGSFILISVLLGIYIHQNWLWFTAFVGVNLIQYSFSRWCLMDRILKSLGVKE